MQALKKSVTKLVKLAIDELQREVRSLQSNTSQKNRPNPLARKLMMKPLREDSQGMY